MVMPSASRARKVQSPWQALPAQARPRRVRPQRRARGSKTGEYPGNGGWKGPPVDGAAELGYAVAPARQGRGVATAVVRELVRRARVAGLHMVFAHTLAAESASTSVLARCGFARAAELTDPDEGPVWRWELRLDDI